MESRLMWLLLATLVGGPPLLAARQPATRLLPAEGPGSGPTFQGIGDLPGGLVHSEALAVSDDGRNVVGRSGSSRFDDEGYFRPPGGTLNALLGSQGVPVGSEPRAITPDGGIVAGKIAPLGGPIQAARWTAATGWVGLGDLPGGAVGSQALGISADGSVIVGWGTSSAGLLAARWSSSGVTSLGDLPGGVSQSAAALVSQDGGTIVGTGHSDQGPEVFVSTGAGMVGLGDLPGGAFSSEPFGMTPDAAVIVGEATSASGIEAFRWTAPGGLEGLGDLPGGTFQSIAFDVSADGKRVVGFGTSDQGPEAFVWDRVHGMRRLEDVLVWAGLQHVAAWQLTEATGISADGRVIVGNGTNPDGQTEGWIARLP